MRLSRIGTGINLLLAIAVSSSGQSLSAAEETVDFNRDVRPILSNKCFTCHGPDEAERQADLRLDTRNGALADLGGYSAVKPGHPDKSELLTRIVATDDSRMPPLENGQGLSKTEVDILRRWIQQDAEYARHWSLIAPNRPEIPAVKHSTWPSNAVDAFIMSQLERNGLNPNETANRYFLIRRVSLDLTGLPPTVEEVDAFLNDSSSNAYEKLVDRLLKSDAYGERWASLWLDLARYADSAGYADDPPRTIWLYRNWVINALNNNQPFDQFTIDQIAGDLLPEPNEHQLVATAFHRNTLTNSEGGTNDEEFRNVAIVDRVNTTMQVWMGTTIGCAQCHSHKFDPITQQEYFQLFAFLNNTEDADRRNEAPLLSVMTESQKLQKNQWENELASLRKQLEPTPAQLNELLTEWQKQARTTEWKTSLPQSTESDSAITSKVLDDGWIAVNSPKGQAGRLTLVLPHPDSQTTGIRLELKSPANLDDVSVPTLTSLSASLGSSDAASRAGRFVRVELKGDGKMIHLAEVEVFSGDQNVARKGKASQSSTDFGGPPQLAIDGNTNGEFNKKSVTHTAVSKDPWWEVDLKETVNIDRVVLWNRTDSNLQSRLDGAVVSILDEKRNTVWSDVLKKAPQREVASDVSGLTPVTLTSASASSDKAVADSGVSPNADQPLTTGKPAKGWTPRLEAGRTEAWAAEATVAAPAEHGDSSLKLELGLKIDGSSPVLIRVSSTHDRNPVVLPHAVAAARLAASPTPPQRKVLLDYLRSTYQPPAQLTNQIAAVEKRIQGLKPVTVPIMRELAEEKRRTTKVQVRGNYRVTAEEVNADTPDAFHALPPSAPRNRLGLARWLVSPDNPLTARVIVNRYWEQLFGTGLVSTSEEFGNQGEPPSHPELLDWLAVEFMESGWDVKHLLKLMVMSSTYRQSSDTTPTKQDADPYNQLLSRGPRVRLTAEMIRDQALIASGLLSRKMFGPSVNPPRPKLGLRAAFGGSTDWETSKGEDRYRRALYTSWRRSIPYPSMATFDAPSRNVCTIRRNPTNTPLQALVTLNDPVYIEAAQAMARRVMKEGSGNLNDRIRFAFRLCLTRPPSEIESRRLSELHRQLHDAYKKQPDDAVKMASEPLGPIPEELDAAELATWTVIANVLMNLDETLAKR